MARANEPSDDDLEYDHPDWAFFGLDADVELTPDQSQSPSAGFSGRREPPESVVVEDLMRRLESQP